MCWFHFLRCGVLIAFVIYDSRLIILGRTEAVGNYNGYPLSFFFFFFEQLVIGTENDC